MLLTESHVLTNLILFCIVLQFVSEAASAVSMELVHVLSSIISPHFACGSFCHSTLSFKLNMLAGAVCKVIVE